VHPGERGKTAQENPSAVYFNPGRAQLETNFWTGHIPTSSQYWAPPQPSNQELGPSLRIEHDSPNS